MIRIAVRVGTLVAMAAVAVCGCGASASAAPVKAAPQTGLRNVSSLGSYAYRHGLVPMLGTPLARRQAIGDNTHTLVFQGGNNGVGVTTGKELVYAVYWGSQWGTQGKNSQGYPTFSGDRAGVAPDLEAFLTGLGTGGERWSGVMTQYCEGVPAGSTSCPISAAHVAYPTGGALAGVWEDNSSAAPAAASAAQLGLEAENAAAHFGNTTQASNRNTQYIVISPTGTDPDHYKENGFCAWHDYTGDPSLGIGSPDGFLAFTNLPYVPDAGANCGAGFVNPGNALDGVTIIGGHEYGDLCAWRTTGNGRVQDITLGTGVFAVQGTWSNALNKGAGACSVSHSIVK
jgi:hypothetical protein